MSLIESHRRDGWIEIRLNRPEQRNALSSDLADAFVEALNSAESDAHGCVLTAMGSVFCAGADIKEGISLATDRPSSRMISALLNTPLFVVAAVDAGVYGAGVSLLATCPVVLASSSASVGFPEIKQGFFPVGVAPYIDHGVPRRRLIDLGMNGASIGAAEALEFGLFTQVVEANQLEAHSERWMDLVVAHPEAAFQAKQYWTWEMRSEGFQRRVEELESLVEVRQPTTARSR